MKYSLQFAVLSVASIIREIVITVDAMMKIVGVMVVKYILGWKNDFCVFNVPKRYAHGSLSVYLRVC